MGGLVTPAESGTLTNFVEIGQARDKILSLQLDQVSVIFHRSPFSKFLFDVPDIRYNLHLRDVYLGRSKRLPYFPRQRYNKI